MTPFGYKVILVCLGTAFFVAHLVWAIYCIRFYTDRNNKLEAAGIIIPGLAGVLIVAAALLTPSGWGLVCAVLALPVLVIGRALYESVVFR